MKTIFLLCLLFSMQAFAYPLSQYDEVKVYKSKHRMDMLFHGKVIKSYHVMLGKGGKGPKRKLGDGLVPEGKYILDEANPYSKFFRSIHINYPNAEDIERAKREGVDPGRDVYLHGTPNDFNNISEWLRKHRLEKFGEKFIRAMLVFFDWTAGCVAVRNKEMDEIFNHYTGPVPITIYR